jgi:D-amino-acid dehydrogenase
MSRTVIIGAGAVGLACAYELRKRGEDVVVLDRGAVGDGCSRGNAGWIVPCLAAPLPAPGLTWTSLKWMLRGDSPLHIDPRAAPQLAGFLWQFWRHCNHKDFDAGVEAWARLTKDIMAPFDVLAKEDGGVEMYTDGLLFVFLRESTMRHVLRDLTATRGSTADIRPLVGAEVHAMEPALRPEVVAGIWIVDERHVRPEVFCAALDRRAVALGAEVRTGVDVLGGVVERGTVRALRTTQGDVTADRFIIAAGARTGIVSDLVAGVPLPIQAGKGYSITVRSAAPPAIQRPLYLDEASVGYSPFAGGYRLAGTMELSGINERLVPARVAALRRAAQRYLSVPPPDGTALEWVGMRPITYDGVPVIGALPRVSNTYVATGHGMLGVTASLATGSLLADLVTRGRSPVDLSPFDPARFL